MGDEKLHVRVRELTLGSQWVYDKVFSRTHLALLHFGKMRRIHAISVGAQALDVLLYIKL
jgi:hypothetical protein